MSNAITLYHPGGQPDAPVMTDDPLERRTGWIVVIAFFVVFLGFAAIVRLDAAASATGRVTVSGSRQAVQHRDGGTVAAIHVHEGQHVTAGEILLELQGGEAIATESALAAQVIGLEARRARLLAEQGNRTDFAAPAAFSSLGPEYRPLAAASLDLERRQLRARLGSIASQKAVLDKQVDQYAERIKGIQQQVQANNNQSGLLNDQLTGMQTLAAKGYASLNRVRDIQRTMEAMKGDTANLSSTRASAQQQIGQTRMQALSLDAQHLEDVSKDLRATDESLNDALPRWLAAKKVRDQIQIRATATGQVIALNVFTVGGVIAPGQRLMDIVPDAAPLVVDAMVAPNDADDLHVGQMAQIRFPSLHDRNLPVFEGRITRLSPDALTDEKTGVSYFTAEVTVPATELKTIKDFEGNDGLKPGLPAEVLVPLRKRTMLDYLLEPLKNVLWHSGREH